MSSSQMHRYFEELVREGKATRIEEDGLVRYELTAEGKKSESKKLKRELKSLQKAFRKIPKGSLEGIPDKNAADRMRQLRAILNPKKQHPLLLFYF